MTCAKKSTKLFTSSKSNNNVLTGNKLSNLQAYLLLWSTHFGELCIFLEIALFLQKDVTTVKHFNFASFFFLLVNIFTIIAEIFKLNSLMNYVIDIFQTNQCMCRYKA